MATRQIKDKTELAKTTRLLGKHQASITQEQQRCETFTKRMEQRIKNRQAESERKVSRWERFRNTHASMIYAYVLPRKADLLTDGRKSFDTPDGGRIGFVDKDPSESATEFPLTKEVAVAAILERLPSELVDELLTRTLRPAGEIKLFLLEHTEVAEQLEDVITFTHQHWLRIAPLNCTEAVFKPNEWFEKLLAGDAAA